MRICYWPRAVVHVDMLGFVAAVERRDFPELRGQPIAVTRDTAGGGVIACCLAARAAGVTPGMRLDDARRLCPDIVQRPARPGAYAAASAATARALADIGPDVEACSPDELAIDVTHCQRRHGAPEHLAQLVQDRVAGTTGGLACAIGVAGDKLAARLASGMGAPGGITVIPPWEARERLCHLGLDHVRGIEPHIRAFLRQCGAHTCGDVAAMPMSLLVRRYGMFGKQLWLLCQGRDTTPAEPETASPRSVGYGKVLPPRTVSRRTLLAYARHTCQKVATRLRRGDLQAGRLYVALRYDQSDDTGRGAIGVAGIDGILDLPCAVSEAKRFFGPVQAFIDEQWDEQPVSHVRIAVTRLQNTSGQLELFSSDTACGVPHFGATDYADAGCLESAAVPAGRALARGDAWPDGSQEHIAD